MKTIVVVDDNLMMREFLHQFLSKHYEVITFENGIEAMAYIESNKQPDVMLLDYEMDVMNGYEDIPVILLSGKKTSETRIACLKSGAKDFITKPFNPAELELRIENAMN
jgi:DNA-binding response OmpR family regulator